MKKRLLNVRAAVVLAFAIGCGAGFSYLSLYNSFPLWWLTALVPAAAAFVIFFIVRRNVAGITYTLLSVLLFLYGAIGVGAVLKNYSSVSLNNGGEYTISGTVREKSFTQSGEYIVIDGLSADGTDIDGAMTVYLGEQYGQFCEVGYSVRFGADVYVNDAFAYGNSYTERILSDIRYTAYPNTPVVSEYGFSLFGSINSAVRSLYFDNLDRDTAAIVYAMYTGNVDYIQTSTMDSFRYGGVAHVFAVSGMHIVLVYGAVSFVLKRLRLGQVPVAVISVILVFFYTGMCGFTLSAVRAAIMCAVAAAVRLAGGKYDGLVSLSLAFTAILLVNPLNITSVGFQLSVAAVAGIVLFCSVFTRALKKIKFPDFIASSVAMTLSAQIGTFPILLSCFGYVSWATLALNIVFVPLLSAIFTVQFAATLFAFVLPPLSQFFCLLFAVPTEAVTAALVVIRAEDVLISGFEFGIFTALYFLAVYIVSGHVNIRPSLRAVAATLLAAVIGAGLVLENYLPQGTMRITASAYYDGSSAVLFTTPQGNVLVISQQPSAYDISSLIANGNDPDAVIILGGEESAFAYTLLGADCGDVYVYYANLNFQPFDGVTIHYLKDFTVAGIDFAFAGGYDIVAEYGGMRVGVSCGGSVAIDSCDLLFYSAPSHNCECSVYASFNQNGGLNMYDCGDLQFVVKDGTLYSLGNFSEKGALL